MHWKQWVAASTQNFPMNSNCWPPICPQQHVRVRSTAGSKQLTLPIYKFNRNSKFCR